MYMYVCACVRICVCFFCVEYLRLSPGLFYMCVRARAYEHAILLGIISPLVHGSRDSILIHNGGGGTGEKRTKAEEGSYNESHKERCWVSNKC